MNERVPLPTMPPAAQTQHTPLKGPPLRQTTARSPSPSRCKLIIPLLGCAKVPLVSMPCSIYLGDANTDRALCFLDSSVVGGTISLLVDVGGEQEG